MRFQNQYSALANHRALTSSLLCIPICVIALGSVGCTQKVTARLTEVEIAKPVRADVPVYSEWIGTTVGYIDAQIHSKVTGYVLAQDYKEGDLDRKSVV